MGTLDLDPARIAQAVDVIDPRFLRSPQYEDELLNRHLGRRVMLKNETCNPLRTFKGRGAHFLVSELPRDRRIVCSSSGNFGAAIAYACRSAGIPCTVFLHADANPVSRGRIAAFGAEVIAWDGDDALKAAAADYAKRSDCLLVEDGRQPAIAEGAGTIGIELLEAGPIDTVVVQVGDGALITGIACWIRHASPGTRVIGVCAEAAPGMAASRSAGAVVRRPATTMADGLAIEQPVAESLERLQQLVDDVVLVSESAIADAMRLAATTAGVLVEPSGAAGLAALLEHDVPGVRTAILFTGSVLRPAHFALLSPGD